MIRFTHARRSLLFLGLAWSLFLPLAAHAGHPASEKKQAMEQTQQIANQVISDIRSHQSEIKGHPKALLDIVDRVLLPHVDSERMSRLALGRYWRKATPAQRKAFTKQFRLLLVRTYAGPLSRLGNQKVKVTGTKPGADSDELVVQSVVTGGDLGRVPVDYRMVREGKTWKYYDLVIDGISLINNYRGSFAQEIQNKGIEGLIHTLEHRNES